MQVIPALDTEDVCLSGGADGADLAWGTSAAAYGHSVVHWTFRGHRSKASASQIVVLAPDQLLVADPYLEHANLTLKRRWPVANNFVASLLRRNYYQVAWSDSCYAISALDKNGLVKGGTAWATQMFTDMHPDGRCYVFDQNSQQWYQWKGAWCPIIAPPRPTGVYAGIGSRELNPDGERAIMELYA
jgi:hypothetical protein